jgi:hypothetical protein
LKLQEKQLQKFVFPFCGGINIWNFRKDATASFLKFQRFMPVKSVYNCPRFNNPCPWRCIDSQTIVRSDIWELISHAQRIRREGDSPLNWERAEITSEAIKCLTFHALRHKVLTNLFIIQIACECLNQN